jgi:hypothetical protein
MNRRLLLYDMDVGLEFLKVCQSLKILVGEMEGPGSYWLSATGQLYSGDGSSGKHGSLLARPEFSLDMIA